MKYHIIRLLKKDQNEYRIWHTIYEVRNKNAENMHLTTWKYETCISIVRNQYWFGDFIRTLFLYLKLVILELKSWTQKYILNWKIYF